MFRKVAWFIVFAVLAVSCLNDPDCYNLNNNVVGISFRKIFDGKADTVAMIAVRADGTDSVFYDYKLLSGILFPLNYLDNKTKIYFQQPDGTRSLALSYLSKAQFVSEDCGERFVLSDLKIDASDFDSTRLLSSTLTKDPSTNIFLYRCPVNNLVKFSFRQLFLEADTLGKPLDVTVTGITADYAGQLYAADTFNTVKVPLNPAAVTTAFTFNFTAGSTFATGPKSISFNYTKSKRTLFEICGEQDFYSKLSIASTDFPIVKLVRDTIQDPPLTNVIFQRCPETNLLKIVFKVSTATNANAAKVSIKKITAGHTPQIFYENSEVSTVTLPLDLTQDATSFVFEFASGVKNLTVSYTRTPKVYHQVCGASIEVKALTFTQNNFTNITTKNAEVKFPTVTNFEIVNN